jgi:hypothetical protein
VAVSPQDLVYAQLATSVANPTAPDPFAGLRSYQDCKLACTRAGGGIDEACMTSCFAAVVAGLTAPQSQKGTADAVAQCKALCRQRYTTCFLDIGPFKCSCFVACEQSGGAAKPEPGFTAQITSLIGLVIVLAGVAILLAVLIR